MLESIVKFFTEAFYLWAVTAAVVVVASIVNYLRSSRELEAFKSEIEVRKTRYKAGSRSDDHGSPAPAA